MNKNCGKFYHQIYLIMIIGLSAFFLSCVAESTRSGSSLVGTVNSGGRTPVSTNFCTDLYDVSSEPFTCVSACPSTATEASETEKEQAISTLTSNFQEPELSLILDNVNAARGICVSPALRPTEQIHINSGLTVCLDKKVDSLNNLQSICDTKPNRSVPTLYGTVSMVGADVRFNESINSLEKWCTTELEGSRNPECRLELESVFQTLILDVVINDNSFEATLDNFQTPYGEIFKARIFVEDEFQQKSFTTYKQFQRKEFDNGENTVGLFKVMPVSQYHCVSIAGTENLGTGDFTYDRYIKTHFYFASNSKPQAIPQNVTPPVLCHDVNENTKDDATFPRLGLRPQHFALWNANDPRFIDLDDDDSPDINKTIEEALVSEGANDPNRKIFHLLRWPNMPAISGLEQNNPNLGIFMQPWIENDDDDSDTPEGNAFCPTDEDLNNSQDPVFRELSKYIGETEGIYLAESQFLTNPDGSFVTDVMIIRETDLEKVWFYEENNLILIPNQNTVNDKTIRFYWPFDTDNPTVRKSDSILYTVKFPNNIGKIGTEGGLAKSVQAPDKRFGCVPKVSD